MFRSWLFSFVLIASPVVASGLDIGGLATLPNLARPAGNIATSGRLKAADVPVIAAAGVKHVIDLTRDGETPDFDEAAAVREAGMQYHNLPIGGPADLTAENVKRFDRLLTAVGAAPTLVHCSSSNRVGAMAALRAAWIQGLPVDAALAEGRRWGLKALEGTVHDLLAAAAPGGPTDGAATAALKVYGPGGPAPAMKAAAETFSKESNIRVEVTAGPTPEWKDRASSDADLIFSGSEAMMTDFLAAFPQLDPGSVKPLYLRPSAILVRPGNPKRIRGLKDLFTPGVRVLVVQGSGQGGLWEDVAGRLGDIASVRALRSNIAAFSENSGEARKLWQSDPTIDAWLIWNIWQTANPTLADLVEIEPEYRIYRDTGIAYTARGKADRHARAFVEFLSSAKGAAIFARWGWKTSSMPTRRADQENEHALRQGNQQER